MNERPAFLSSTDPLTDPAAVFAAKNRIHLAVVLTLLLLLLYSHHYWYIKLPLSLLAIVALVFPSVSQSWWLWACVTGFIAAGSIGNWYALDNHKYLLGYWCLALCCFFARSCAPERLAATARAFIGLVFGFAVLQKTLSRDFLDGRFIYYELLLDERFDPLARYLGAVPVQLAHDNQTARSALVSFDSQLTSVQLQVTRALWPLAIGITAWTYACELIIAAAFLWPRPSWLRRTRDVYLIAFLATTYLFAPVIGFGWVLAIMGVAQTSAAQTRTRMAYVGTFVLLQAYRLPWVSLFSLVERVSS